MKTNRKSEKYFLNSKKKNKIKYIYPGNELYPFKGREEQNESAKDLGKDLMFPNVQILKFH